MAILDKTELAQIDHIAIPVEDIEKSVKWYCNNFNCQVTYQDHTWAFIQFGNIKLALVIPEQHPAHIAFVSEKAESFGTLKTHRDGTRSVYVSDPSGNSIEVMAPYEDN
jgi:catechol 2,3-dioxygenase-like lactoylglutathione lyase family enzyme